jgi:hypothetical protein
MMPRTLIHYLFRETDGSPTFQGFGLLRSTRYGAGFFAAADRLSAGSFAGAFADGIAALVRFFADGAAATVLFFADGFAVSLSTLPKPSADAAAWTTCFAASSACSIVSSRSCSAAPTIPRVPSLLSAFGFLEGFGFGIPR